MYQDIFYEQTGYGKGKKFERNGLLMMIQNKMAINMPL